MIAMPKIAPAIQSTKSCSLVKARPKLKNICLWIPEIANRRVAENSFNLNWGIESLSATSA
jgi:hypothetical protein